MGRSAFDGVSDGEWAVFAEKVVAERDEARARIVELTEEARELRKACKDEMNAAQRLHEELQRVRSELESLRQHERECVMECAAHERDALDARKRYGIAYTRGGTPHAPVVAWHPTTWDTLPEALEACERDGWRGYVRAALEAK